VNGRSAELLRKCDTELAISLFSYNAELFLTPTQPPVQKGGSFPTEKRPGHGDKHPHPPPFSKEVKKRVELYLHLLL
jgi:hypothetical protein